jgi:hypothetical protein
VAALGTAILGVTTTTAYGRLWANYSNRAYYLAESGGEYAGHLLRLDHDAMPSGTFVLSDDCGRFTLSSSADPSDETRVRIVSTGIIGDAQRQIRYNLHRPGQTGGGTWEGSGDIDDDNSENPDPGDLTYQIVDYDGDQALLVQSLRSADDFRAWIFIRESLRYISVADFLRQAWEQNGHYLSYDAQVKLAIDFMSSSYSYMCGLNFRMTALEQSYGLSIVKAHDTSVDGIPTEFVPDERRCLLWLGNRCLAWGDADMAAPMIVLWQDTGSTSGQKKWLVYHLLTAQDGLLYASTPTPKNWDTLLVRAIECPSIYSSNVSGLQDGDVLTQGASRAVVSGEPLFETGNQGAVMLRDLTGSFSAGVAAVNGSGSVGILQFRQKDNFIWSFIGDVYGSTPNANPYDTARAGHPRGEYDFWPAKPVSAWTIDSDRFTLVTWDASNPAGTVTHNVLGPLGHPSTVVRTADLVTPSSGSFIGPEIGLHTFGWNNVDFSIWDRYRKDYYFDDFALKVDEWGSAEPGYQY